MTDNPPIQPLAGSSFDLYSEANLEIAGKGARGERLTESEIRTLCTCVIRHGAQFEQIKVDITKSMD